MGPDGPPVIVVSGGVVSVVVTVKARLAGDRSGLPAPSVANTAKVCEPSASAAVVKGVLQAVKAAPSMLHWKVEPGSVEEKVNVGVESPVAPDGPESITVSGGVLSPPVLGSEVTAAVSDVVETSTVQGPALDGLVMPLNVTRTWSLAATDELLNSEHWIVSR